MGVVVEHVEPLSEVSVFLREALARVQAAPRFLGKEAWNMLASYDGPIVSGNPEGKIPDSLEDDDNEE